MAASISTPGKLLPSQRNDVFLAVQASGLDPKDFDWEEVLSAQNKRSLVSRLRHSPTGFHFHFDLTAGGSHWCKYAPGSSTPSLVATPGSWTAQVMHVSQWLGYLKRETEAPDLWATLSGGSALTEVAASAQPGENTPFTRGELQQVEASLAQIRAAIIASHPLTADRLERIDANLKYLRESAERLGRKDWLNVAVSVVINIIMTSAVPPETGRHILTVAGSVLSWVLGGSPLLPTPLH